MLRGRGVRGLPLKTLVFDGNVYDGQKAEKLIRDLRADHLIADKSYDSKAIAEFVRKIGMEVVIPS